MSVIDGGYLNVSSINHDETTGETPTYEQTIFSVAASNDDNSYEETLGMKSIIFYAFYYFSYHQLRS